MNNNLSKKNSIESLYFKQLEERIPIVSDQILIDLVNGFQISEEMLLFRERRGILGKLIDITGEQDRLRQLRTDKLLIKGQQFLTDLLVELNNSLTFSYFTLQVTRNKLKEIKVVNSKFEEKLEKLDLRLERLEINQEIDLIVDAWSARRIYTNLPWVIQIAMLSRGVCSNFLSNYELKTGDKKYRQAFVDKLIIATGNHTDQSIKELNPDDCLSLTQLLSSCNNISSENNQGISDIEVAAQILDSDPFLTLGTDINPNIPYLMTIGKTLNLLSLSKNVRPDNLVKGAIQICRNQGNFNLYNVKSLRNFVAHIVNETADSHLSLLTVIKSNEREQNPQDIKSSELSEERKKQISPVNWKTIDLNWENVTPRRKFGLVLAGGGAKGAYEAGVLKYMAEKELCPYIIAGTSIGALNGAVVASYQSFNQGVQRVIELWDELGQTPILTPNKNGNALFNSLPLETFLRRAVVPDQLRKGIELWVAAFPSLKRPNVKDNQITQLLIDILCSKNGQEAHYFKVKDSQDDEILYEILLASAAIPIAFPPREINGQSYIDGFLGDNVPLKALALKGCSDAIVIHLENGSLWNRYHDDFQGITITEIRPRESIGSQLDGLNFNSEYLSRLKNSGYDDARHYLQKIKTVLESFNNRRNLEQRIARE
jgi:NTE family protein